MEEQDQPAVLATNGAAAEFKNAYFLSLELTDVRAFAGTQTLDLRASDGAPARWTLILGENGTGKTTLLQLLALSVPTHERRLSPTSSVLTPSVPRFMGPMHFWSGQRVGAQNYTFKISVRWAGSLPSSGTDDMARVTVNVGSAGALTTGDYFAVTADSITYAYGANRRRSPTGLSADRYSEPIHTLFDDDATLRNPEEWLLQAKLVSATGDPALHKRAGRQFERMTAILTRVLPDVTAVDVRNHTDSGGSAHAYLAVCTSDGWIPYSSLGLGYRTMTAWMVDLASRLFERYGHLEDPLSGAAVCLVDEIDLHLHPRWQRDLIDHLTKLFPNTQFIATAHSPLIVQAARDANIVVLRREGDHVIIDNEPQSVRGWRLDQILTSDLFGLPSARPPELDGAIRERDEILGKRVLTNGDEERLKELRRVIGALPSGDTPEDIEAMDIIRRAAKSLRVSEP